MHGDIVFTHAAADKATFDAEGRAWGQRADELASWAGTRLVNRTDVWGRYRRLHRRTGTAKRRTPAPTKDLGRG